LDEARIGITLRTLGRFSISVGSTVLAVPSTYKARALLAFLAMNPGRDLARERLMETFWPAVDPQRARDSLNTALHAIRRCFRGARLNPDAFIIATRSVVRWLAETDFDAERLTSLGAAPSPAALRVAIDEYGEFLPGCYDDWSVEQRERLSASYERALVAAVRDLSDVGAARKLLDLDPYEESAYLLLLNSDAGRASPSVNLTGRSLFVESGTQPSPNPESRRQIRPVWRHDQPVLAFVGRDRERADVDLALRVARTGQGAAFILHGDAGIGKSALLERCEQRAASTGVRIARVRSVAGDPRRFGPWPDIFGLGAHERAAELAGAISRRLQGAWLLVVDDAHHLRSESLDVFVTITNLASSLGCVIVAATRPEGYVLLRQRVRNARPESMAIGALSRAEVVRGLRLSGLVDEGLAHALYRRSAGHPLFVNGLLGELVRAHKIVREPDGWVPREAALRGGLNLPTSLAQSIADRLRSRGPDAAQVACAIALEPDLDVEDISNATELPPHRVLDAIDDLLALDVIEEAYGPRALVFRHDLYLEVAQTLSAAPRRGRMLRLLRDHRTRSLRSAS
jgi:DNA-binding SARP family transcriptional activator